ncbi:MAG: hypothetical protein LJE87_12255 [Deltaproteobacteria bacterium]|jgi:hypothetical protein|nr:hypothetical protein [Deltaproteobacteria bacterium]
MITRWIPWRFLLKRAARSYGVIDPVSLLARLRRFAQPSEVQEPIELLRAGIIFHARGLINTKAIQHNLDWVWPYWVEKQFNPDDPSFIPRAFSFSHVNLTHRNWTAVGQPDLPVYPIVDPRGLVTPFHDGWSLDFWVISKSGNMLLPSRLPEVKQRLEFSPNLLVRTQCHSNEQKLEATAAVEMEGTDPYLSLGITGRGQDEGWMAVSIRPYNPEGIQFIEEIAFVPRQPGLLVDNEIPVEMSERPERVVFSTYDDGDVIHKVDRTESERRVSCVVGMATAAALFPLLSNDDKEIEIRIPLERKMHRKVNTIVQPPQTWTSCVAETATLNIPDGKIQFLFDAAVRSLVLLSADDVVPGPYTYKRFWFRDACLMINGLLALGFSDRCHRLLATFLTRQKRSGYFQSQKGEWDSNGQVLWIFDRFHQLTRHNLDESWMKAVIQGVNWIRKKRGSKKKGAQHPGLLPAGFSAEHFGPNDYYYWDDFWAIAGLKGAARLAGKFYSQSKKGEIEDLASDFERTVFASIEAIPERRSRGGIPASPNRRLDAGAIGSLVADYPLQLTGPYEPKITRTIDFLMEHCFHSGGFFQDMIHSGINAYLTLSIAQSLLRYNDSRYRALIESVAELASPTGQWPEAIHPITGGGCMGDGQHGWAAAEWIMMMRNLFVREEGDRLILGSGVFPEWLESGEELSFGPTLTPYGGVSVSLRHEGDEAALRVDASWFDKAPEVEIKVPGYQQQTIPGVSGSYRLEPL